MGIHYTAGVDLGGPERGRLPQVDLPSFDDEGSSSMEGTSARGRGGGGGGGGSQSNRTRGKGSGDRKESSDRVGDREKWSSHTLKARNP